MARSISRKSSGKAEVHCLDDRPKACSSRVLLKVQAVAESYEISELGIGVMTWKS